MKELSKKLKERLGNVSYFSEQAIREIDEIEKVDEGLLKPGYKDALRVVKEECDSILEKSNQSVLSDMIKTGNTILVETTDGISYTENQFYHITNDKPDWRNYVAFSIVKVGHSDSGSWISYDEKDFKTPEDFLKLLETFKHSIVDYSQMEKYIEFCKTIPE